MIRRFGLRVGTGAVVGALIVVAAPAYTAFAAPADTASLAQGAGRPLSTMRLIRDDLAADRGIVTYSKLTTLQARQTASFEVEVTDVGKGPGQSGLARVSGDRLVAPQDVPTGGIVSVQSICSDGLTCTARSSTRRVVAGQGRSATWRWDVTARSPGEGRILVVATSYRRESKIVVDRVSDVVRIRIQATPLYLLESGLDAHGAVVFLVLGALVAAGAIAAALVLLGKAGRGEAIATPHAGAPGALTEPLRVAAGSAGRLVPAGRPAFGWGSLLCLALADIAAGGIAMVVVRAATTTSPAFAIVAGAVIAGALPLYVLPLIIAYLRAAPDRASVAVINVLLGWTYLGWVAALALAVRDRRPGSAAWPGPADSPPKSVMKRNPRGRRMRRASGGPLSANEGLARSVAAAGWRAPGKEQDGHG